MGLTLLLSYRCPNCGTAEKAKTDMTRMPRELADRFIHEPDLTVETECNDCIKLLNEQSVIDLGEIKPGDERIVHMVCRTVHGPDERCPLGRMN